MPNIDGIGKRLQESIAKSKYTQKQVSEILRISDDSITRYVKEKNYPKIDILYQICELINEDITYIITGKKEYSTEYEKEILECYNLLPELEKGILIGIARNMADKYRQQESNIERHGNLSS